MITPHGSPCNYSRHSRTHSKTVDDHFQTPILKKRQTSMRYTTFGVFVSLSPTSLQTKWNTRRSEQDLLPPVVFLRVSILLIIVAERYTLLGQR